LQLKTTSIQQQISTTFTSDVTDSRCDHVTTIIRKCSPSPLRCCCTKPITATFRQSLQM